MNPALIATATNPDRIKTIGNILKPILIFIIVLFAVLIFKSQIKSVVDKVQGNKADKQEGTKLSEWAQRLKTAGDFTIEHGFTDEQSMYEVAKEVKTMVVFGELSKFFKKKFDISLADFLRSELEAEELQEFYSYLT